jgi:beta-fructofuranosidase
MRAGIGNDGKVKDPVDSGEMWECPDFFPLGDRQLLIISTERMVKYMLGSYADRRFQPETAGIVDFGSYYAARTMANTGGRRILWGWLTESRSVDAQRAAGWSGVMSLPRELSLDGSRLQIRPAVEVGKLRGKQLGADAGGDCLEIQAEIDPGDAQQAGLKLRSAPDGSEQTLVYYDRAARRLAVDKSKSSLNPAADRKMQSGPFDLAKGEPLRLHIFLDGSVIEIFANERACLTARVYPESPRSTRLGLFSSGGKAKLASLEGWEMRPISPNRLTM